MKAAFLLGILCTWVDSACLLLLHTPACGRCLQERCPPMTSPCDGLLELDDCKCCFKCPKFLGNHLAISSSERHGQSREDDADQVVNYKKPAVVQKHLEDSPSPRLQHNDISNPIVPHSFRKHFQNASIIAQHDSIIAYRHKPIAATFTPYPVDKNKHTYAMSSTKTDQIPFSEEGGKDFNDKTELTVPDDSTPLADVLHKTTIKETEQPFTDSPLQQTCQTTMDLGTTAVNLFLADREPLPTVTLDTTKIMIAQGHLTATDASSFIKDETTAAISRGKRESEIVVKTIGAVEMYQVLIDGSIILKMLTNSAPQQMIRCALSQISIPGSHILADIVRTIMEGIHDLAAHISESKFVAENPNWDSLKKIITESIDKGFAKASTSIPKITHKVKEFLSYNPALIELGSHEKVSDKQIQAIKKSVVNIKTYLESISKLFEEVKVTEMQNRVKSDIMQLVISGSKIFAVIADTIMNITNVISKSVLELAFIKGKPSLQSLLEAVKNSITVSVPEGFKEVSELIGVIIEAIENNSFIHREDTTNNYLSPINGHKMEPLTTLETSKVRPIMNTYLKFMCDNFRYSKSILSGEELAVTSPSIATSVLEFLIKVDAHIMKTLINAKNIVCTSEVLEEIDSWNNLLQAVNLAKTVVLERLALFQSKYNFNSNHLNQLLNHMGCDGTIKGTLSGKDYVGNKTFVEVIQVAFKYISKELKMKTDEIIASNKNLNIKLSELPGGNVINMITKIVIQVVNEISRKMNESPFITETPTWFKFWFSVIDSITAGTMKAVDIFVDLIESTKSLNQNETREKKFLKTDTTHERFKRRLPNKVSIQDLGERNVPKQNSLASSYHNIPSSAAKTPSKKSLVHNTILKLRKSESAQMEKAPEIQILNINLTKLPSSFSKRDNITGIKREKREIEFSMKRIKAVQILHEVLKDGSVILQMLTNWAPQQVVYCALIQLSIPGTHILADIATTIMEAVHESVVYISQSKSVAENPTWDSLRQVVTEAIEKGFDKASASAPKIIGGVEQFLSFNPSLTESGSIKRVKDGPAGVLETIFENLKLGLGSICHLLEAITSTKLRLEVKSEILDLTISGSKIFAQLTDGIMRITSIMSKSLLESGFIKGKPSLQNLLEAVKDSIIVGVTEGFKVAPELIHVTITVMERNGFIQNTPLPINGYNMDRLTILKATTVRPIMNAYLQVMCNNFGYSKPTLQQELLAVPSMRTTSSFLEFLAEVDTYIMETLFDIKNIVCASKVLEETDSWNELLQAGNFINNIVFERLALFQAKYHLNSTDLNQLLDHMGCNGTVQDTISDKDSVGNKTFVEIIQTAVKYITDEIKMKTDEMIATIKKLNIMLAELPGGKVITITTEITIRTINEMSRKMSESVFVTEPPTWFNFWLSFLDVVTVGTLKVVDVFNELVHPTEP